MNERKLDSDDQNRVKEYLRNLHTIYGVGIIITVCMSCERMLGAKDGEGEYGISHGVCPACQKRVMAEIEGRAV
jgi:hypothetical protein